MDDFKFFHNQDGNWVEGGHAFELMLSSDIELPFKLSPTREMKDININVETDIPFSLAVVNDLDSIHTFTTEDTYTIPYLTKGDNKYLVLKLVPPKTGDYKGAFSFGYKVK